MEMYQDEPVINQDVPSLAPWDLNSQTIVNQQQQHCMKSNGTMALLANGRTFLIIMFVSMEETEPNEAGWRQHIQ
jgi:hypothetical protein